MPSSANSASRRPTRRRGRIEALIAEKQAQQAASRNIMTGGGDYITLMPITMPLVLNLIAASTSAIVLVSRRWVLGFGASRRLLDHATMVQALMRLGELALAEGHRLTLVVVGGAALVLNYRARLSTQDVDAFFIAPPEASTTRRWARFVAREMVLPADWLNDGAKGYMQEILSRFMVFCR